MRWERKTMRKMLIAHQLALNSCAQAANPQRRRSFWFHFQPSIIEMSDDLAKYSFAVQWIVDRNLHFSSDKNFAEVSRPSQVDLLPFRSRNLSWPKSATSIEWDQQRDSSWWCFTLVFITEHWTGKQERNVIIWVDSTTFLFYGYSSIVAGLSDYATEQETGTRNETRSCHMPCIDNEDSNTKTFTLTNSHIAVDHVFESVVKKMLTAMSSSELRDQMPKLKKTRTAWRKDKRFDEDSASD